MDNAEIKNTIHAQNKHPAIFPTADFSIVLSSEIKCSRNLSATCPSKIPAIPSVIAFPTTPQRMAPETPAK